MTWISLLLQTLTSLIAAFLAQKDADIATIGGQLVGLGAQIAAEHGQPITTEDLERWKQDAARRAAIFNAP